MRVDPSRGLRPKDTHASDLLRNVVSGGGSVDQSTRDQLRRMLSDGYEAPPQPAGEPQRPQEPAAPQRVARSTGQSMEEKRRAGMDYVRRLRIYAR